MKIHMDQKVNDNLNLFTEHIKALSIRKILLTYIVVFVVIYREEIK